MEYTLQSVCEKYNLVLEKEYDSYLNKLVDIFNNKITEEDLASSDPMINNIFGLYFQYEKKDVSKMMEYYQLAIERNNVNSLYNLSLYYYDQKNYEEMLKYLNQADEKGYIKASLLFLNYYGEQKDFPNMLKHLQKILDTGNTKYSLIGMYNAGVIYKNNGNTRIAENYWIQCSNRGYVKATFALACYYSLPEVLDLEKSSSCLAIAFLQDYNYMISTLGKTLDLFDFINVYYENNGENHNIYCKKCKTETSSKININKIISNGKTIIKKCDNCQIQVIIDFCQDCNKIQCIC
jgi:tetratricopeptide (TPR) repeat protein